MGAAAPAGPCEWNVDELRDFTRRYVVAGLDDGGAGAGPAGCGVLVVDETGFAKKGRVSAGVARQYTGTLGGVFPCQIGVMAAWATSAGQALVDRELYLPKEWTGDRERCRARARPGHGRFRDQAPAGRADDRPDPARPARRAGVGGRRRGLRPRRRLPRLPGGLRLPYAVNVQAKPRCCPARAGGTSRAWWSARPPRVTGPGFRRAPAGWTPVPGSGGCGGCPTPRPRSAGAPGSGG